MRETMLGIMEGLESYSTDSNNWHMYLRRLYLLSMGEYKTEIEEEKPKEADAEDSNSSIVIDDSKKTEEESKETCNDDYKNPPQGKFHL